MAPHKTGMRRAAFVAPGLVLLAAFGMGGAHAAGLGKLSVLSGLGQPLRAEIELTSVGKDEAATLAAHLAPIDAYSKSNIEYTPSLSTLRFVVAQHSDGSQYLSITSLGPVNDPFLDMLIQLDWASGRLVREYTVLLDPPELKTARPAAVTPVAPITSAPLASGTPTRRGSTASSGSGSFSPASPRTPSASAAGASGGVGGSYEVKRGDTAAKIARENKPDGVTLEQMLVALLRTNPSAFDGNNVNRMHTGALMQLPDAASAKGVESADAQRLISAQSADFNAYRTRVGSAAASAPAEEKPTTQAASGKLTAKVAEKQEKTADASDQLKLSKPGQKGAAAGAAAAKASGPSAEDLAVKDRALKEADERVKLLEKNVSDLQKLLDLKNQNLAQLQKQIDATQAKAADAKAAQAKAAAAIPPVAVVTAPPVVVPAPTPAPTPPPAAPVVVATKPPVVVPNPAPVVVPNPAPVPVPVPVPTVSATPDASQAKPNPPVPAPAVSSTPSTPDATTKPAEAPKPVVVPAKKPVVVAAPPAPPSGGILDDVLDNALPIGGGVLLLALLAGYGIYHQRRKKKFSKFEDSILTGASGLRANSVFGTTGGQSVDTANSAFNSNFVPMSGQMDTNEVDPVAEADVYIAYGRDAQAEEILKEALRAQPERHAVRLKLLEIYAKRQDAKSFETIASELYAQTGGVGDEWHRAATLGASFDSANPLYRDAAAAAAASPAAVVIPAPAPYEKTQQLTPGAVAGLTAGAAGIAAAIAAGTARAQEPATSAFPNTLPMEPILDLDLTKTEPISSSQGHHEPVASPPAMDLDFDLGFGDKPSAAPSLTRSESESVALAGKAAAANNLDFDLDLSGATQRPQAILADGLEKTVAINPPPLTESIPLPSSFEATVPLSSKPFVTIPAAEPEALPMLEHPSDVDFSLDLPPVSAPHAQSATSTNYEKTQPFDSSFADISLDLDHGGVMHAAHAEPAEAAHGGAGKWQDMATKLDLAVAYRDIGDKDGARELLEEVMKEGDAAQIDKAKELMSALA